MKTINELNVEDHFHMWGTGMTNISICMAVHFEHNNYSIKFNNLLIEKFLPSF